MLRRVLREFFTPGKLRKSIIVNFIDEE